MTSKTGLPSPRRTMTFHVQYLWHPAILELTTPRECQSCVYVRGARKKTDGCVTRATGGAEPKEFGSTDALISGEAAHDQSLPRTHSRTLPPPQSPSLSLSPACLSSLHVCFS